ncbi:MAG: NAD(P)/FAD-dependent oxidoreductase [Microgenomates group bacterium]
MDLIKTDICIIGAGSGGLSLAAGAAQMGARVVLIEAGEMGGDCLNTGCVPSKALLAMAKQAKATGITGPDAFTAAKDHVRRVIETIAPMDSQDRFEGFGVRVIRAFGSFTSPKELVAGGSRIQARRFVIATGSTALVPAIPGIDAVPYLTNETIFDLAEQPSHLLIIGGGPIGMEMAQAHRRLGSDVTVIQSGKALSRDDPETAAFVLDALRAEGITIHENAITARLRVVDAGVEAVLADGQVITGSHLLVAAGRKPALDSLNLKAAGVAFTDKGITVGANLRSSNRRVYAIGDVAGGLQFTHVAGAQSGILIRQILLGLPASFSTRAVPWVTYTQPELAQVGLTEAQARHEYGGALTVLRQDFHHNDRAVTEGIAKGLLKVMVVRGRPVGASIAGPQAGELIALWTLAISAKLKISAIAGMILPYPTLGEVSKRAAGAYFAPKLFDNPQLKRFVRFVQRVLP